MIDGRKYALSKAHAGACIVNVLMCGPALVHPADKLLDASVPIVV